MYETEKEMRDRLKLDSKSDLIGKLIMAYMTIRQLQAKLQCAKNTDQQVQADSPKAITPEHPHASMLFDL